MTSLMFSASPSGSHCSPVLSLHIRAVDQSAHLHSDRDGYNELHHAVMGLPEPSGGFLQAKAPGDIPGAWGLAVWESVLGSRRVFMIRWSICTFSAGVGCGCLCCVGAGLWFSVNERGGFCLEESVV